MNASWVALLSLLFLGSGTASQAPLGTQSQSPRIEAARPTIFLDVESQDRDQVRFRLHNNMSVAVAVRTLSFYKVGQGAGSLSYRNPRSVLPPDVDIRTLHSYVEKDDSSSKRVRSPDVRYPHTYFDSWISPGNSIRFTVPSSWLRPGLSIYVPFQFEWELSEQLIFNGEPKHRVYFRGVDLAREVK